MLDGERYLVHNPFGGYDAKKPGLTRVSAYYEMQNILRCRTVETIDNLCCVDFYSRENYLQIRSKETNDLDNISWSSKE